MSGKVSVDERRRLVAESLRVGNPGNNARDLAGQVDLRWNRRSSSRSTRSSPYEHNPRRATNAKFDDIKESIRTSGLRSPLTVTRRPGESHFIVEAGGNTRLLACGNCGPRRAIRASESWWCCFGRGDLRATSSPRT